MINRTDEAYKTILRKVLEVGKEKGDRTGTGTISIFSHTLEIDMSDGFPLITTKKMFTKGIIHELLWFLNGDTNIQYLVKNGINIWTPDAYREYKEKYKNKYHITTTTTIDEFKERIKCDDIFAKEHGELGPIYGKQWVNWGVNGQLRMKDTDGTSYYGETHQINQIQNAIDTLKTNPDSRRIMVNAWNVGEIDDMALPPCHWAFELYTEELSDAERYEIIVSSTTENEFDKFSDIKDDVYFESWINEFYPNTPKRKLSLKWHQRSVDTFLGLPFNIASYGLLLEMFAQQCNMVPDKLVGDLTNVHIYKNHIEQCEQQLEREPLELPKLQLDKTKDMFSYSYENVNILNYSSHPSIKGEISV